MLSVARVIDGAAEDVKHARVDPGTAERAKPPIQAVRIGAAKVLDAAHTEVVEVSCDTGTDAGNLL